MGLACYSCSFELMIPRDHMYSCALTFRSPDAILLIYLNKFPLSWHAETYCEEGWSLRFGNIPCALALADVAVLPCLDTWDNEIIFSSLFSSRLETWRPPVSWANVTWWENSKLGSTISLFDMIWDSFWTKLYRFKIFVVILVHDTLKGYHSCP